MKKLIFITGASGIGKTLISRELLTKIDNSALIESNWFTKFSQFDYNNDETLKLLVSNISSVLINYLKSSDIADNLIFVYEIHMFNKKVFFNILAELELHRIMYKFCPIILECDLEEVIRRMKENSWNKDKIEGSLADSVGIYDNYSYPKLDISQLNNFESVSEILDILYQKYDVL